MPSFIRTTAGGKAISGGSLQPRGRRGNNSAQASAYWAGGQVSLDAIEYLIKIIIKVSLFLELLADNPIKLQLVNPLECRSTQLKISLC